MTYECYDGTITTTVMLEDSCVDAGNALSENESLAQASIHYVIDELLTEEEFTVRWRKKFPIVGNKAHLFGRKGVKVVDRGSTVVLDRQRERKPRQTKMPLPETVKDETWIAPVQAAKYLGVPPQYVYQKISKGRLKTQGERPKMVLWGDVRRCFGA